MNYQLTVIPSECLAPAIDLLAELDRLGITPASINIEWKYTTQTTPYLHVWLRYRTEFERLTKTLKRKTATRKPLTGQRHYYTTDAGPLIECMSFAHQDDWEDAS